MKRTSSCALLLLSLAACTQPPSAIDLKGQNVFSRSGERQNGRSYAAAPRFSTPSYSRSSYSAPSTANQGMAVGNTEQTARISSIGVSDLAPPQKDSVRASKPSQPENFSETSPVEQWRADNETATQKPAETASINKTKGSPVELIHEPKKSSFIWPVNGHKILSSYGKKGKGQANDGINIAASEGEPVWAVADGEIVYVGDELSGYGNMVILKHAGRHTTTYAHLSQATVDKYDRVKQGDIIGYVGATGSVKSPQLYFAVRDGKESVDPKKYLGRNVAGL